MTTSLWTIILAAGQGSRLARETRGLRKQFLALAGQPLYWRSVTTMARVPGLSGAVLVFPPDELDNRARELENLKGLSDLGIRVLAVAGGDRRQDSVRLGLAALPPDCGRVLVHDSARPFFSAGLVAALLDSLVDGFDGVIPATPVTDTIKEVRQDLVRSTPDRSTLRAVQTPQLFPAATLRRVHEQAQADGWEVTDDAGMIERAGGTVRIVAGE